MNFSFVVLAIAAIALAVHYLKPPAYDEATLCIISDDLPPHTAIILDKTDEYSEIQADLISEVIRRTKNRLSVNERLTIFELDAKGHFDPRGRFSLCNPGRGSQVNPLFRNPQLIETRYAELFDAPLENVLADLVTPKEAPSSPILEALARLSQTEAFSDRVPERAVVLVSDMLQNSDVFSAYGGAGEMPEAMPDARDVADRIIARFGDGLQGTELEIRLISREKYSDMQRVPLKAYWNEIFDELGVIADWRDL
jgi:hypothetical protein